MAIDTTRQRAELQQSREAAIRELRLAFQVYGLDVSTYSDYEVSRAVIAEATADTCCSSNLFARAVKRLQQSQRQASV